MGKAHITSACRSFRKVFFRRDKWSKINGVGWRPKVCGHLAREVSSRNAAGRGGGGGDKDGGKCSVAAVDRKGGHTAKCPNCDHITAGALKQL